MKSLIQTLPLGLQLTLKSTPAMLRSETGIKLLLIPERDFAMCLTVLGQSFVCYGGLRSLFQFLSKLQEGSSGSA